MQDIFYLVSLGCPKNLVDSEVLCAQLLVNGFQMTDDPAEATLYLINSCAFLPSARREVAEEIREAVRWKKRRKNRRIVVAGCLPERLRDRDIQEQYPEVDLFLRVDAMEHLVEILRGAKHPVCEGEPTYLADHRVPRLLLTLPFVAYLKISDGCDNRCCYCSIPLIRGGLRSRPMDSVLTEARDLIAGGVRELVVIAQDITAYGADRPESGDSIGKLVRALNALKGNFRIRLLYTHPAHYSDDFIAAVAESSKVIPYFDIPLQHISDRILSAQHRHVTQAQIRHWIAKIRKEIPGAVLRTTFIAGLPGETEAEFEELKAFMREIRFERAGVFSYAAEPDTPAAEMPDQVPNEIAEARAGELMELQQEIMQSRHEEWIGRKDKVLIQYKNRGRAYGRGTLDAPDIDNDVVITGGGRLKIGEYYDIVYERVNDFSLEGSVAR